MPDQTGKDHARREARGQSAPADLAGAAPLPSAPPRCAYLPASLCRVGTRSSAHSA